MLHQALCDSKGCLCTRHLRGPIKLTNKIWMPWTPKLSWTIIQSHVLNCEMYDHYQYILYKHNGILFMTIHLSPWYQSHPHFKNTCTITHRTWMMALTLLPSSAEAKVSCMHFPTSITRTLALFCQGVRVAFEGRPTASSKVPKHDVDVAASILSLAMVGVRSSWHMILGIQWNPLSQVTRASLGRQAICLRLALMPKDNQLTPSCCIIGEVDQTMFQLWV